MLNHPWQADELLVLIAIASYAVAAFVLLVYFFSQDERRHTMPRELQY